MPPKYAITFRVLSIYGRYSRSVVTITARWVVSLAMTMIFLSIRCSSISALRL